MEEKTGKKSIRAVAYCRFSSEQQRGGYSIEAQVDAIKSYCSSKGYSLGEVYIDEARSARSDKRPRFQDMILDSKSGVFDVVVVHKLDRFSRNRTDFAIYGNLLKNRGIRVESVTEKLDPDAPESIILQSVIEGMAEFYSANLGRETKKGLYERASKGLVSGKVSLGYRRGADGHFEIDAEAAKLVASLFSRLASGERFSDVVRDLKSRMVRGANGKVFTHQSLERLIANPCYVGDYRFGDKVFQNVIPPIVSRETFALANAKMSEHDSPHFPKHRAEEYGLTGLAYCGECGSRLTGHSSKNRQGIMVSYYRCIGSSNSKCSLPMIKKDLLEMKVIDALRKAFIEGDGSSLQPIADGVNARIKALSSSDDAELLKKSKSAEESKRSRLLDAYLAGAVDLAVFKERDLALQAELAKIEARLSAISMSLPDAVSVENLQAAFKYYFLKYEKGATSSDRARLFSIFVSKVIVYKDRLTVYWKLTPKPSESMCESSAKGALGCLSHTTFPDILLEVSYEIVSWRRGVSAGNAIDYRLRVDF